MDPIYYQLATNRKQENVRRSGDTVRAQATNEKEKATKTGKLDDSELSADVGGMSGDDLLGSMDPDLFGSGGGATAFQQTWEEILAEDEDELFDDGEDEEEDGDGEQQRQPPQDEIQEEEGRKPLKEFELAAPAQAEEVERPPVAEGKPPSTSPEDGMREPPQEEAKPEPVAEKKSEPPKPDIVKIKIDAPTFSSLLDLTGGFLIAEETLPELSDEQPEPSASQEEIEEVAPDLVVLLDKLIVGDASSPGFRKLQHLLGRFGRGVLRICLEQNSRVFLLPRGSGLASHPLVANSGMDDAKGAVYLTNTRSCVVEEECLLAAPDGFHPVLFYFAHAFDHALGGEDFASMRSPAVQASYQAGQLVDPLAGASPVHYFAQAVESYLNENDCLEPLWTRFDLYDFDRSMYEYVDYLFKRANK